MIAVITGPSGVGKSTVINELLRRHPNWHTVRSYTTREQRVNEDDSKRYIFVSRDEFVRKQKEGDIVESEEAAGNWYGTSRASFVKALAAGTVVVLDLRLDGVKFIKSHYPQAKTIYIYAPLSEVRRRLNADPRRVNEPAEIRARRLAAVARLNRQRGICDYRITSIPGDIDQTVAAVESAIMS